MASTRMGVLAFVLFVLPAAPTTHDPAPTPEPVSSGDHAPTPDRYAGWPGEYVRIDFPDPPSEEKKFAYDGCWVALGDLCRLLLQRNRNDGNRHLRGTAKPSQDRRTNSGWHMAAASGRGAR